MSGGDEKKKRWRESGEYLMTTALGAIGGRFRMGAGQRSSIRVELGALNEDSFGDDSTHVSLTCSFGWRFGRK